MQTLVYFTYNVRGRTFAGLCPTESEGIECDQLFDLVTTADVSTSRLIGNEGGELLVLLCRLREPLLLLEGEGEDICGLRSDTGTISR